MKKLIIIAVICLVVGGVAGYLVHPKPQTFGASTTGATWTTPKTSQISLSLASATSSNIYNGTGQDVFVSDVFWACSNATTSYTAYTGAGLASLVLRAATSSTAASTTNGNLIIDASVATGTTAEGTAGFGYIFTSTTTIAATWATAGKPFVSGGNWDSYVWPSATYIQFWSNATNTAQCTAGVNYISL